MMKTAGPELSVPLPDILEESCGEYRVKGHRITLYHADSSSASQWHRTARDGLPLSDSLAADEIEKVFEFYRNNHQGSAGVFAALSRGTHPTKPVRQRGPQRRYCWPTGRTEESCHGLRQITGE